MMLKVITNKSFATQLRKIYNESQKTNGNSLTLASLENATGHRGLLHEVSKTHVILASDWVEKLTQYNSDYLSARYPVTA